jgi:hypothetical protein
MRSSLFAAHKRKKSALLLGATPSAAESSLVGDPFEFGADGVLTSTLTGVWEDAAGEPLDGTTTRTVERTFVSAALSSATGTAAITNNGTDIATIVLTVLDSNGTPLPGIPAASCVLAVSGTGNTVTQPIGSTDANGQISGSFVSTNSETKTASWTVCGLAVTDTHSVVVSGAEDYSLRAPAVDDLYLDPAAGVDGSGTEASPWNVFTNAKLSTLTAGKILWIKNGTFNWASLTTLNSGTSGSRIKIAAYPGHAPVATLSSSTTGFDSCYGFGKAGGCSYWDIVGITFDLAGRAGIMFGATQWSNPALAATYVRIIDCIGNTTLAASDNGGILFFDSGSDNVQVIRGTYTATGASGGSGTNRALIWADYQRYIKVIGCVLNAAGTSLPFYYKHTNAQTISEVDRQFKNNIVRGGSRGTLFCGKYFQISNNVFDGALVDMGDQGGGDAGRGENTIVHNTFRNATLGLTINGTGGENYDNTVRDNVITGTGELWDNPYAATDFRTASSYNCYDSGSAEIRRNSTTYSLSGYKTAFTDRELNSMSGTVTFNGSVPSSTAANWLLAAGSAGENAASDGTDCGVNITNLLTVN